MFLNLPVYICLVRNVRTGTEIKGSRAGIEIENGRGGKLKLKN